MKEPLDELLVQACAAQQQADSGSAGTAGTSQCANAICAAGAPHTPAAAENSHHRCRLCSAGNNRLCLLA